MEKFEEDFGKARKKSTPEWRITSMTIVDRKKLRFLKNPKKMS